MDIVRLKPTDTDLARDTFEMMATVFGDFHDRLTDDHLARLLARDSVWAYAALVDDHPVGALTAHVLPLTRTNAEEILVYDIAVRPDRQRQGVGRLLIDTLLTDAATAGIGEMWVPASNDDTHAIDFYRRTGGAAEAVTIFTYPTRAPS